MINTVYLLQASILLILAMYIFSVKNTALNKGWQLFQEISLHVTLLINAATAAADDDGDDGDDDDDDDVLTSQPHRSFTKILVSYLFILREFLTVVSTQTVLLWEVMSLILYEFYRRLEEYVIYIDKCNTATRFDPPTGPSTGSHMLL
jgi:hypothetical protein